MTNMLLWKMAIEIVDFPMNNGGSFHSYVHLPEGNSLVGGFEFYIPVHENSSFTVLKNCDFPVRYVNLPEGNPNVCLVGGLEHVSFFHILGIIIPTDFFQSG